MSGGPTRGSRSLRGLVPHLGVDAGGHQTGRGCGGMHPGPPRHHSEDSRRCRSLESASAQTRTVRSRDRSFTSPQRGHAARIVAMSNVRHPAGRLGAPAQMTGTRMGRCRSSRSPTGAAWRTRPRTPWRPFAKGLELGASGLESDVWLSADGQPVLVHDERVVAGPPPGRRVATRLPISWLAFTSPASPTSSRRSGTDFELSLDLKDPASAERPRSRSSVDSASRNGRGCASAA